MRGSMCWRVTKPRLAARVTLKAGNDSDGRAEASAFTYTFRGNPRDTLFGRLGTHAQTTRAKALNLEFAIPMK